MTRDDENPTISVNADDDEIVIQAGALQPSSDGVEDDAGYTPSKSWDLDEPGHGKESVSDSDEGDSPSKLEDADIRYETTGEDLETVGPMNKMRLVILFGGLLIIIGFIAYFVFLR